LIKINSGTPYFILFLL